MKESRKIFSLLKFTIFLGRNKAISKTVESIKAVSGTLMDNCKHESCHGGSLKVSSSNSVICAEGYQTLPPLILDSVIKSDSESLSGIITLKAKLKINQVDIENQLEEKVPDTLSSKSLLLLGMRCLILARNSNNCLC